MTKMVRLTVGIVFALIAVAMLPAAQAQTTSLPAGVALTATDVETQPVTTNPNANANLCYIDSDGDGGYDAGEPILWRQNVGAVVGANAACGAAGDTNVEANDVTLSGADFGKKVLVGTPNYNIPVRTFQTGRVVCYYDADGNNRFTTGDTLYLLTVVAACRAIAVGDLRLTPYGSFGAGTYVVAGNQDINLGTIATGLTANPAADFDFWDTNGDAAFNSNDVLYIDTDASGTVTVMDVRLTPLGTLVAGTIVAAPDTDAVPVTTNPSANANLCYIDSDGDGGYDAGEPIVWRANTGAVVGANAACGAAGDLNVEANDVTLSGADFGKKVLVGTPNYNIPVRTFQTGRIICYYDADGNNRFTAGDTLYLLTVTAACRAIAVGDLRLTPYGSFGAGTYVVAGNSDINLGTIATGLTANPAADFDFWDANGDAAFNSNDILYVDTDATGTVTVMDVRLTPFGSLVGGTIVSSGDGDAIPVTILPSVNANLCYIDSDGDGGYDAGEPILWRANTGAVVGANAACGAAGDTNVEANDVTLNGADFGKKVLVGTPNYNIPVRTFQTGRIICYYDADGNNRFTTGDTLYLQTVTAACRAVAVGDLRLTAYSTFIAGTYVVAGNTDINLGTIATGLNANPALNFRFWDTNGDAAFNSNDILYDDTDASATVTVMDVRLSGGSVSGAGAVPTPVTPTPGTPTPTPGTPTPTPPANVTDQLQTLIQQNAALSTQLNQSLTQSRDLQSQISNLNTQLANQTTQLSSLNSQISTLQQENARLNAELAKKGEAPKTPGFEAIAALAAIGVAVVALRRKF